MSRGFASRPRTEMPCVNEQTVHDLILGRLEGQVLEGVEHHVAACSSCAALIAVVARRTGSVDRHAAPARTPRPLVSKPSLAVGTVVGRFVIVDFLGAGGMGEVYAAYDPNLERKVAIKFLRPDVIARGTQDVAAERMRREARLVAKLSHPNVVTVFEIDVFDGRLFIAMEFVDGQSVAEWLKAEPRARREVLRVFLAAGAGLAAAHAAGVVHRDFKPHNVMIAKGGEVRVMDFGLAHLDAEPDAPVSDPAAPAPAAPASGAATASESSAEREARLTRTGTLLGTPAYMAPEQMLGMKATARADQYSFCVALHEALFGQRPSEASASARARTTGTTEVARPGPAARSVPGWIRRIVKRGLSIDPADRYPSMDDLLADLRADRVRRRRIALALVAGAAIVGGGTWAAVHEQSARQIRLCRANVATASAVWPLETGSAAAATPAGAPAAVSEAFRRSGVADAAGIFTRVSRALSEYLAHWAKQATEACEATHVRREQSRDELALRMACLDDRLSTARALTDTLLRADASVVTHAADAALGLPDLDRCSNLALLAAVKPPDRSKQAEVTRLRRRMAELKLLTETGHFEAMAADIKTLEHDVRAIDYPPLLVDFLLFMRTHVTNSGVPAANGREAREALRIAETAGYEEGIAQALVAVAWSDYGNPSITDLALAQADAVLQHIGNPTVLRAWFENDVSFVDFARGRFAQALARSERSLALKQQRTPPDARDVGLSESNICLILPTMGRPQEALPHCQRGAALIEAALGPSHPNTLNLAENHGFALVELGRLDEGCPLAERAQKFFTDTGEGIEGRNTLLVTLARCAIGRGRPEAARRLLEPVIEKAMHGKATELEIAELEWPLARAVYATGDHARGVDIAGRAAKRYATLPELAFRDREIHAWLAARRKLNP
jgi:predicted Ser/Thr protein kinase